MERTEEVWARIAADCGIEASRYHVRREWRKRDARRDHLVQIYASSDHEVVFKQIYRPKDEGFATALAAQKRACVAMGGDSASVPRVLAASSKDRAMIMAAVPGETAQAHLEAGGDAAEVLERAGRWIAAFHRASGPEARTFQPRFMRDHIAHLLGQLDRNEIAVANPRLFKRHAGDCIALASNFEGRETMSSATHGDMNLRNILLDGPKSAGIDFTALHSAPVGFDIARLLLHFTGLHADPAQIPEGHVVPPEALAGFFRGYTLVGPEDPSVGYLLRVRLLMDWVSIPARLRDRSFAATLRLERLRRLASRAFP
ncbi:Predicted kinase, aminoglycoside phosphotransferase (APT) family [Poseidonocella pacifica]|uniref:Predicted kinase, aminoglycoside phosphotransferase (APT) family n=1 Tax=Poseidonocella pacifica TaxID=871651 RepID=A0A1I0XU52_9RHOB|nr:phosphotransferase [Poseidonocella pacifica]SFB04605.1 Predicted kinase, aminoglycoside phosphotransferase (APT) family [Poseidonocella pacifica]